MSFHKRLFIKTITIFLSIICFVFTNFAFGCASADTENWQQISNANKIEYRDGFSVHFLDVGEGDSIFIRFPDGKNMLIDCARPNKDISDYIIRSLKEYSVESIDYLLLTHVDQDHIGNALEIIDNFEIDNAYIPEVKYLQSYSIFEKVKLALDKEGCNQYISSIGHYIIEKDYCVAFLSPSASSAMDSSYLNFNDDEMATEQEGNDISPIVYLEYKDVRFLFTGDAGISQEELVINNYKSLLYKFIYNFDINLRELDFLKVAHHGSNTSSCLNFLGLLTPKNSIISVGGENFYGHPSSSVIDNLIKANENINIYRTDIDGTISVFVNQDGNYSIKTHKKT